MWIRICLEFRASNLEFMATITRIVQQKDQKRVNIYLDGKFAFGLTLESLMSNSLKVGQELSSEEVGILKNQSDKDKVFARVLRFVTSRPHSEKEVNLWFKKKKVDDQDVIKSVFDRLKKLELVDDEKFAKWWIEQRNTFRPKPRRVLKQELRMKGISDDIFENAYAEVETIGDLVIAKKLAEKRWQRLKSLPQKEAKQKLMQFLAMRGFSWDIVRGVIDQILQK